MANLKLLPRWTEGIYQLEETDPVMGGENGIDNQQAKDLGNRTEFLKLENDKLNKKVDSKFSENSNNLNELENKINQKLPITGGKLTGDLDMGGNFIKFGISDGGEATIGRNKSGEGFAVWEGDYKDFWTNGREPMLEVKDGENDAPAGVFNYGTRLANVKDTQKIIDNFGLNFNYNPQGRQKIDLRHLSTDKYYLIISSHALDTDLYGYSIRGGYPHYVHILSDNNDETLISNHSSKTVNFNFLFRCVAPYWGNWYAPDYDATVDWNYYGLTDKSPILKPMVDYRSSRVYFYARGGWTFDIITAMPNSWEICTDTKNFQSEGYTWDIQSPIDYDEKLLPATPQQQLTEKVFKKSTILSERDDERGHVAEGYTILANGLVMQFTWFGSTGGANWPIAFKRIYTVTNSSDTHVKVSYNNTKVWQDVSTFTRVFAIGEI